MKQTYYKVRDLARALGMDDASQYKTIYRALKRNNLLFRSPMLGRCWFVRASDLRTFAPEIIDRLEIRALKGDFSHLEEDSLDTNAADPEGA